MDLRNLKTSSNPPTRGKRKWEIIFAASNAPANKMFYGSMKSLEKAIEYGEENQKYAPHLNETTGVKRIGSWVTGYFRKDVQEVINRIQKRNERNK